MRTLRSVLIRIIALVTVAAIGLVVLFALGSDEGSARTTLAGMRVTALSSASDKIMYASVNDPSTAGVYRSTDGGHNWQLVSRELSRPVNTLAVNPIDPKVVYAGTEGGSIALQEDSLYVSTDAGARWQRTPLLLPASPDGRIPSVLSLAVASADAGTLYVGTDGQGIYKLTDRGTTMTSVGDEFYRARVEQIAVTSQNSDHVYAVTSKGLFESKNGGDAWTRLDTLPEKAVTLAVAPSDNQVLYLGTTSMGAYRSDDGGQTWKSIGAGLGLKPGVALSVAGLQVDPQNARLVYATPHYVFGSTTTHDVALGVYVSQDGGETWTQVKPGDSTGPVNALMVAPQREGEVYLGTDRGVFLTDREGKEVSNRGSSLLGDETGSTAFPRVVVILATVMAGIAVLLVNPMKVGQAVAEKVAHSK